jgi:hypothetical protein
VITFSPSGSVVVEYVAVPAARVAVPIGVPLMEKLTVPVGVPLVAGATAAKRVTFWPGATAVALGTIDKVVDAWVIVRVPLVTDGV